MHRCKPSSRWALWAFVAALLLKSAMPWLATVSAEMQGKALVEVCSVYGVALAAPGHEGHQGHEGHAPSHDHSPDHGSDHCALTALTTLAGSDPPVHLLVAMAARVTAVSQSRPSSEAPDACATWVARLKHGPPLRA